MISGSIHEASLIRLRRRWWLMAALAGLSVWLGYQLLRQAWHPFPAWRWTIAAAGALAFQLIYVWRGLEHNYRQGEHLLLPTLGSGNHLTLLRGLVLALLAGFLLVPRPSGALAWLPAALYTLAILADLLDGYLARVSRHTTVLGESLDMEFDCLGMLVAIALAVHYAQIPLWYLPLGFARYLFLAGIWLRRRQGKPVHDLPHSLHGRMLAGIEMGYASVLLWPVFYPPATVLAGVAVAVPILASFLRDWLIVGGRIDPASPRYLAARRRAAWILTGWLPVGLRFAAGLAGWLRFGVPLLVGASDALSLFAWPGLPFPHFAAPLIGLLALVTPLLLILGAAGRLAALGLLAAAGAHSLARGLDPVNGFLIVAGMALMILGSGWLSAWRPEDSFLLRRAGSTPEESRP
jgi:CDP-diacylglycerol--glycerol-3-phosphate 3-phosphatidyltransferase